MSKLANLHVWYSSKKVGYNNILIYGKVLDEESHLGGDLIDCVF